MSRTNPPNKLSNANFTRSVSLNGTPITTTGAQLNQITDAVGTVTFDKLIKVAKVALGNAADTGGAIIAWQNPEATSIIISRIEINLTTVATGACTADFGTTATNATTSSDNLIDGVDLNAAIGVFDNITDKGTNGKSRQLLASGKWVTGSRASGAVAGLAGYAYIFYHTL